MKRPKKEQPEPTRSELEILQVLWKQGPSTVRLVNDILNQESRPVQYTSTLKLMQIMVDKGMLLRDESSMKHIYRASLEEKKTKGQLLNRFVNTLFNGSASELMMQLLGNSRPSEAEMEEIRLLLNKMGKEKKADKKPGS